MIFPIYQDPLDKSSPDYLTGIGYAIEGITRGNRAFREGWPKNTYIVLISFLQWYIYNVPSVRGDNRATKANNFIAIIENGVLSTWSPSHEDLLATDWGLIDLITKAFSDEEIARGHELNSAPKSDEPVV